MQPSDADGSARVSDLVVGSGSLTTAEWTQLFAKLEGCVLEGWLKRE